MKLLAITFILASAIGIGCTMSNNSETVLAESSESTIQTLNTNTQTITTAKLNRRFNGCKAHK